MLRQYQLLVEAVIELKRFMRKQYASVEGKCSFSFQANFLWSIILVGIEYVESEQSAQIALADGYILKRHSATDIYHCLQETK